jgi:hypothetical protein
MHFANLKKNQKHTKYSTLFLDKKMQKIPQKTHFGFIGALDLQFCSRNLSMKFIMLNVRVDLSKIYPNIQHHKLHWPQFNSSNMNFFFHKFMLFKHGYYTSICIVYTQCCCIV